MRHSARRQSAAIVFVRLHNPAPKSNVLLFTNRRCLRCDHVLLCCGGLPQGYDLDSFLPRAKHRRNYYVSGMRLGTILTAPHLEQNMSVNEKIRVLYFTCAQRRNYYVSGMRLGTILTAPHLEQNMSVNEKIRVLYFTCAQRRNYYVSGMRLVTILTAPHLEQKMSVNEKIRILYFTCAQRRSRFLEQNSTCGHITGFLATSL
ncbi:hypothetical protein J6590_061606 [Homalodisca vitripennis]|nr:hypothetical protein J6590_061606 [Homalodisca vitripennis]